jgi:hypothetical protein
MIKPYRVETRTKGDRRNEYVIIHIGDGDVCWTTDIVLAYQIADLLNQEAFDDDAKRNALHVRPMLKGHQQDNE